MTRMMLAAAVLGTFLAGCQPTVVSPLVPVAMPLEPAPSTKLTVVGTGNTAEEARGKAIDHMVHQVILPPTEPEDAPTSEFVDSMIRGYNVASVAKDFLGKYYVKVELTITQLGINYQELYHSCQLHRKELSAMKSDVATEEQLRRVAEEREKAARDTMERDRKAFADRLLELQADREGLSERLKVMGEARKADDTLMTELRTQIRTQQELLDKANAEIERLKKQQAGR